MLKAGLYLLTHLDYNLLVPGSFLDRRPERAVKVHRFRWITRISSDLFPTQFSEIYSCSCVIIIDSTGIGSMETNGQSVQRRNKKSITQPSSLYSVIDIQLQGIKSSYI